MLSSLVYVHIYNFMLIYYLCGATHSVSWPAYPALGICMLSCPSSAPSVRKDTYVELPMLAYLSWATNAEVTMLESIYSEPPMLRYLCWATHAELPMLSYPIKS